MEGDETDYRTTKDFSRMAMGSADSVWSQFLSSL